MGDAYMNDSKLKYGIRNPRVSDIKTQTEMLDGRPWYYMTNGNYIYYCKASEQWNLCYSEGNIVYYVIDKRDKETTDWQTPPTVGWENFRRRLKSRAELLAERFARHCASVARH